jgi:hypothetical protein
LGDYFLLDHNVVPGIPLAAWAAPTEGQLVVRDNGGPNWFDLAANSEVPVGMVLTTNGATGTLGIVLFTSGTQIVLPFDTAPTIGQMIQTTAAGLKVVGTQLFSRSQVKGVASGGIGSVIGLATFGVSGSGTETTATVEFI